MPKTCRSCYREVSLSAKFCSSCGAPIVANTFDIAQDSIIRAGREVWDDATQLAQETIASLTRHGGECAVCHVPLSRANRKDGTQMCYRCYVDWQRKADLQRMEEELQLNVPGTHLARFYSWKDYKAWRRDKGSQVEIVRELRHDRRSAPLGSNALPEALFSISYRLRPSSQEFFQVLQQASDDIPGQIKTLAELKKEGILTEQEFEKKKQELLSRL